MSTSHRAELQQIRTFPQLIRFLRDEMGWPIESEEYDDLVFDYEAEELGLDAASAAKIKEIKRLRPLAANQPWGIFFVSFEPKRLPVVALRRILSAFVMRKRESANAAERMAWETDDLLFISNYGEGEERQLSFAHFSQDEHGGLPTLRVLGWDNLDTPLHLDHVADQLTEKLAWPRSESDVERWRETWGSAFTLRHGEVIATSKALAVRLAELARAIRDRIETALAIETEDGPVTHLMKAFKEALVHDLEADDFADMYAQTVAYGLLSARIANPEAATADGFAGQLPIASPFLKELMETFLHVGGRSGGGAAASPIDFDELGVSEVVELLDSPKTNMEAVVRDFGDRNPQEDPVIHFYEDFLKEYDKKQKVKRGVFYTPRPVVSYIVRSVDELLRSEFGLVDGLADITTWGEMIERHEGLAIPDGVESTAPFVTILDLATGTGTFLVETIDVVHRTLVEKWKREGHGEKEILDLWNDYVPKHLLPRLYGYELLMAPYAIAHLKIGLKLHETGYRFRPDDRLRVYLTNALEPAHDSAGQFEFAIPALAHEAEAVNRVKGGQRFTVVLGNPPYAGTSQNPGKDSRGKLTYIGRLLQDYYRVDGAPLGEKNPKWLQNDYVKFIRLAQLLIDETGTGVVGLITDDSYLDNPTFRGMRQSLLSSFGHIRILDLHGNSKKKERAPDGSKDANVFDIMQGVSVGVFAKHAGTASALLADMYGTRESKYADLLHGAPAEAWSALTPRTPFYLFRLQDDTLSQEYQRCIGLAELMPTNSIGVVTGNDSEVLFLTEDEAAAACSRLGAPLSWLRTILYRPFNGRYALFDGSVITRPRLKVVRHLDPTTNVALVFTRSTSPGAPFDHVFCVRHPVLGRFFTDAACIAYFAPLFLAPKSGALGLSEERELNFTSAFTSALALLLGHAPDPLEAFGYVYGLLYSPAYRRRYAQFVRTDFPRLPLPGSIDLFSDVAERGSRLMTLHLLESPGIDESRTIAYHGPAQPVVGNVRWAEDVVWLDASATGRVGAVTPSGSGFQGVPKEVWNFHIGGYQVCDKWLKDRRGRALSEEDITHYLTIVAAIAETIRIMGEIDEVIEEHGGWPGAFSGGDEGN